jgi:hypothetical protein
MPNNKWEDGTKMLIDLAGWFFFFSSIRNRIYWKRKGTLKHMGSTHKDPWKKIQPIIVIKYKGRPCKWKWVQVN